MNCPSPSSGFSIRLIGDYSRVREHCCDAVIIRETELAPFFVGPVGAFPGHGLTSDGVTEFGFDALDDLATRWFSALPPAHQAHVQASPDWPPSLRRPA